MRLFERDDFQPRTFIRGNRKPLKKETSSSFKI